MTEDHALIEARAEALVNAHADMLSALIALRHRHQLSQQVVAERMGVSQPTVAAFEHYDSNPTLSSIRRYALAVGALLRISVEDDCGKQVISRHTDSASFSHPTRPMAAVQWEAPVTKTPART